ncbi:MAG TPA: S8 family serine peptidase [Candidatus Polarisedimenticolaceae bacterium]
MSRNSGLAVACVVLLGTAALAAPADHTLRLGGFAFDPKVQSPALPDGWSRSHATAPDLHLVQFDGAIPGDALDRLRAASVEPVRYVHPDTYVVWGRAADRDALRGAARIRWTGDFAPAYRVLSPWRERSGEMLDMRVLIYRGAGVDAVASALSRLGTEIGARTIVDDTFAVAGFRLPGALMRFAAAIPGVYSIQPLHGEWASRAEVSDEINVNYVDELNVAYPGYQGWLSFVGLSGVGVTVAVVDEGVDEGHPDLEGSRLACIGATCTAAGSRHGTHVAGIVTGSGASGITDANGFLRGLGVAPESSILEQEFIQFKFVPGGVFELISDSSRNGATISNNSWGTSSTARGYDADAMMIDAGVRDADPTTPGNQPLLYVQALGNGNGGVSSQGTPDEAKNVVVVGSTWAVNLADGNPNPNIDSLSDNSAHGPALDGRRIPHLVAPGCHVDSTFPDVGAGYEHGLLCGTSMAAPQVSGAAALFTQYYRGLPAVAGDPSPALVKAALLATARDLAGNQDADGVTMGHRPDDKQGWGRMDLDALVRPPAGSVLYYDQARVFEESGENWLREVVPVNPAEPMRIQLVWTDAPGPGLGGNTPAWNNDLDLVVESGGNTYRGNVFGADGWSVTGGVADGKNNAEGVAFAVPPGQATIRVVASNLNSDGVPRFGDAIDQDFALVCRNCAYAPGFDLDPRPVTADVCAPAAGRFTVEVEALSGYATPVTLSLVNLPPGMSHGFDVNPVAPGASSTLTVGPGAVGDGNYTMRLDGDAAGLHREHPLYLHLRTASPAAAALSAPTAGATDVSPQPTLEWAAVPWAASYVVEVSADPTFQTVFYSAATTTPTHKVEQILAQGVTYHWRVRSRNVCGFGPFSPTWSFTTRNVPPVLLVDDDWDYWGDFQADYVAAMNALPLSPYFYPVTYDVWDVYAVMQQEEPDLSTLALYEKVIWWSGREDFYPGPDDFSELELQRWFDRKGGCLFLSSSDYVFAQGGVNDFMRQRLGVGSVVQDTGKSQVTGQGTVFGGLGTITLKNLAEDYSDTVSPDATSELAFSSTTGNAGVDRNGAHYRTAFLGFGAERLFRNTDREKTLLRFLQWCDGLAAVDGDGDGVANAQDCDAGDAAVWTAPSAVTDLRLAKGVTGFDWSTPQSAANAVYDLLRTGDAADFWNATCVASGTPETSVPAAWDTEPAPGQILFYLVRARSACGTAPMGTSSNGTPRQGTACE